MPQLEGNLKKNKQKKHAIYVCTSTHISNELADKSKLAEEEETLVIWRLLVYLWRGQLSLWRDKGGCLAIPACNKQHNIILII